MTLEAPHLTRGSVRSHAASRCNPDRANPARKSIHLVSAPDTAAGACVRAMLLHKGLAFDESEKGVDPAATAIVIDGQRWTGSAAIARELDRLVLTRPLWPGERRSAALSHSIACWTDESLGTALQVHLQQASLQSLHQLKGHLSHADALLEDPPFLLGLHPWLCDFALLGQLSVMSQHAGTRNLLKPHLHLQAFLGRLRELERS